MGEQTTGGAAVDVGLRGDEQAALRRVATLVAQGVEAERVFAAVSEEVGRLVGAQTANTYRFVSRAEAVAVGSWSEPGALAVELERRIHLDGPTAVPLVFQRCAPVRIDDYAAIEGAFASYLLELGIRSTVAAPIVVQDEPWGALTASTIGDALLAPGAERQIGEFAVLISQSLANHEARRQLHEERDFAAAVVELSQALICVFDREGRVVRFNRACEEATGFRAEEVLGRDARGLIVPPEQADEFDALLARAFEQHRSQPVHGEWLTKDGGRRTIEFTNRPLADADGRAAHFVSTGLDVTERERATAEIVRLAAEQAALRRVATLVARSPEPEQVFAAVAEEAGRLLGNLSCAVLRFNGDGTGTIVGRFSGTGDSGGFPVGRDFPVAGDGMAATVARTGCVARLDDYSTVTGGTAEEMHALGYRAAVAAPIVVGSRIWGAFVAASTSGPLAEGAEERLADFAELVALAIASADADDQLRSSRARIVEAGDAERRRLERNLHDGAQQRLVTLSLQLRVARRRLREDPDAADAAVAAAAEELRLALEELRELARGLHPAVLSDRGLAPALEALADRAPFPVELAGVPEERLPEGAEAVLYYVVSESLTNAAKHAAASLASVTVDRRDDAVRVEIADDGAGGAELAGGSGLQGLADRVEALGGRLTVTSPPGAGTVVRAELPLRRPRESAPVPAR